MTYITVKTFKSMSTRTFSIIYVFSIHAQSYQQGRTAI